ncbi:MAG: hypothetical protein QOE31_3842 [Solirubrobacteraceae bacterium]|nr:hypothetical protein [Solirubrobacteraceae bacterium]
MATPTTDDVRTFPLTGIDLDAAVTDALANPEIVTGAAAAGISPEVLRGDVSGDEVLAGVSSEFEALTRLDTRLAAARGGPQPRPPGWLMRLANRLAPLLPRFLARVFGLSLEAINLDTALLADLEAERGAAQTRLRTALSEQILRQLRAAVERRTDDSYSTLLKVAGAPGLAQLVDDDYGVRTRATDELEALFGRMPGGSIGLAGRRGIGKSKLIQRMCPPPVAGRPSQLLTTVVSAPTQYDGRDFVLHLFARLCETVVGGHEARAQRLLELEHQGRPLAARAARGVLLARSRVALLAVGIALTVAAVADVPADPLLIAGAVLLTAALLTPRPWTDWGHGLPVGFANPGWPLAVVGTALVIAAGLQDSDDPLLIAGIVVMALAAVALLTPTSVFLGARPSEPPTTFPPDLVTTAHARLDEIQYQRTIASGWTSGVSAKGAAGPIELGAQAGLTGSRTLAQVPQSFPEIVERLRAFLRQAATRVGEVRIGIDELDKLESDETAQRFLNEIKAVFGISRCFFLVSVSEEAMANFDRRGARLRDVFDSSFDEILYVPPLSFAESMELLRQRVIGLPVPYHALCHVLSGGLPRDLIRVARAMIAAKPADADGELATIAGALVALELEQRVRAATVVVRGIPLDPPASAFVRWAQKLPSDVSAVGLLARCRNFGSDESAVSKTGDADAQRQLFDMTLELLAFCYLAATVIEFFGHEVAKRRWSRSGAAWSELESLTSARATSSASPRIGWGLVSAFREAQQMPVVILPERPWAAAGE